MHPDSKHRLALSGTQIRVQKARLTAPLLCLFSLLPLSLHAQTTTATLNGVVEDASGAILPNAQIQLKNEKSNDTRSSVTNGSGIFSFSAVPTGDYDVTISAPGFKPFQQVGIHLDPGDQRSVRDIHLAPGGATDAVTVTSAGDAINLDSGEQSSLISAQEIKHLSVEGRDVTELFKILPGFAISRGSGSVDNQTYDPSQVQVSGALGQYAANGTPLNGVALLSDGADITDPGNFGAAIQTVNYEQVAEVKVQTSSFTADGARGPIVVNAVGKSGGSDFHGSLYTYARTSQLNSTDWLANHTGQQKPPDRQVYPGATLGGPVYIPGLPFNQSKKLTFFVGAEDYAQRNAYAYGSAGSAILNALVPTAGMRAGDFSPAQLAAYLGPNYQPTTAAATACNGSYANICTVPQTGPKGQALVNGNLAGLLDPGAMQMINTLPLPNVASNGQYNYITTNLIDNNLWQARGRLDYAPNQKNHIFGVYSIERGKNGVPQAEYYSPRGNMGGVNIPGGGLLSTIDSQIASLNFSTVFTPTLTNEFYGALAWLDQDFVPKSLSATQGGNGYVYSGLFNNGSHVLPTLEDYGNDGLPLSRLPDGSYGGIYAKKLIRTFGDNLTKVVGPHTLRAGGFFQMDTNHQVLPFINTNGTVQLYYFPETFTDPVAGLVHNTGVVGSGNGGNYLANFMEGHVFNYNQTNIMPAPNLYFFNIDGYIQDHWQVKSRLSIDAGIRLEHLTPWADAHGLGIPVFDASSYNSPLSPVLPGFKWHGIDKSIPASGLASRWAYVEPRFGFAWDTYGTGNTIVRGGFGIYRAHDSSNDAASGVGTVDGQRTGSVNNILLSSVSSQASVVTAGTGAVPDSNATGFSATDDEQPQVKTWNLSVDQRLPSNVLLEIAYVGNYSNKLLNNGSTQNTNLDDLNALPIGSLYGPQPGTGKIYPIFTPPGVSGSNTSVGTLDQHHIDSFKKYPFYNRLQVAQHNLYANYHGLQVGINKQQGRFHLAANYTFSKALGVLGGYNNGYPADPFNLRNDYMNETYDHRHIFNAAYSYILGDVVKNRLVGVVTNGWEIDGITNIQSGSNLQSIINPNFNIGGTITLPQGQLGVSNVNLLGTPDVNLQPLVIAPPNVKNQPHQYINGAAFALNPNIGSNGTYRFGFLPGPAFIDTDLTLAKTFKVNEHNSFQLRAAAFNVINHANNSFTGIDSNAYTLNFNSNSSSSNVAQALSSARSQNAGFGLAPLREGRRIMELAIRYDF